MENNMHRQEEQEDEYNGDIIRDPTFKDLKARCTEDVPINYLNVELGRQSISGISKLLKENWNPCVSKCFGSLRKCSANFGLPATLYLLFLKISVIFLYFQVQNYDCVITMTQRVRINQFMDSNPKNVYKALLKKTLLHIHAGKYITGMEFWRSYSCTCLQMI